MPVQSPGPRLFRSVPFKHIGKKLREGGDRNVDTHLDVSGFVGVFTILVTFLVMVFSTTGELIQAQRGLTLPEAAHEAPLREAPVLIITQESIIFDDREVARVSDLEADESGEVRIPDLYERLEEAQADFRVSDLSRDEQENCAREGPPPSPQDMCLEGLMILQADKGTTGRVLNRAVMTAYAAEYNNLLFAVDRRN